MIIIVEGIDGVGKTPLCKELQKLGFVYLKDSSNRPLSQSAEDAKLATFASVVNNIPEGQHVVVDRLHLTEYVYGGMDRNYRSMEALKVDFMLSKRADLMVVLMVSEGEDLKKYCNSKHGKDLTKYQDLFEFMLVYSDIKHKRKITYNQIGPFVKEIKEWIK